MMRRMPGTAVFAAVCLLPLGVARSAAASAPQVEWRLEEVVSVGALDGPDAEIFQWPVSAGLLGADAFYLVDRNEYAVRAFDFDGRLLFDVGREGEGPGEFGFIGYGWRVGEEIWVNDIRGQVNRFSAEGELVEAFRVPRAGVNVLDIDDARRSWVTGVRGTRPSSLGATVRSDRVSAELLDAEGNVLARVDTLPGTNLRASGRMHPFSPVAQPVVHDGALVVADDLLPLIHIFSPRQERRRIGLDLPEGPRQREAAEIVRRELEARGSSDRILDLSDAPLGGRTPSIAALMVTAEGELWTKPYDPSVDSHWLGGWAGGAGGRWHVFDLDGTLVSVVQMPEGVTPIAVEGEHLFGRSRDDLGVTYVLVFRIRRGDR